MDYTLLYSRRSGPEAGPQVPGNGARNVFQRASSIVENQITGSQMKVRFSCCALLLTSLLTGQLQAQTASASFVSFRDFVQSVRNTDARTFAARNTAAKAQEPAAVSEMRQYLLNTYQAMDVSHSYVLGSQIFDCVPVNQQPTVRALGLSQIAQPPSSAPNAPANQSADAPKFSQLPAGKTTDDFGNRLGCEASTIPMNRVTLDQLSHFSSLQEFLEKGPNGAGHPPRLGPGETVPPAPWDHKYAYAYQYVNNLGANTNINLWRPHIETDINEIFSLAQSWMIGYGSGPVQTVEVGWQNYPARTGTNNSTLFIYWTADGYQHTGCYDLTCAAFVQVSSSVHFGAPFSASTYSVSDGHQNEVQLEYYLSGGNWWLMVNGTWVGYYPGSLFQGGQLSRYANLLEFGSESVGYDVWPPEGSGVFPGRGWTYDAYQRLLWYIDTSANGQWDSLTPARPSPSCYSITDPAWDNNWGIYFWFGGPGGAACE